jgi:Zn-dependent protease with chaperone function
VEWNDALGNGTMEALDEYFMETSELSEEDKDKYTTWFDELKIDFPSDHDLEINFRASFMGPNALALPNGMIVITDSLIELMDDREEFEAVMVHEIAHVLERHSLQMVLRDAGVFIFVSVVLGDASTVTTLSASIPYMLVENGYSRKIESEADLVSGQWLQSKYGSTESLKSILTKLYESSEGAELPEMISTHPDLENRIMLLEETFSLPEDSEE